jgi:excisionase family DNA binding protein
MDFSRRTLVRPLRGLFYYFFHQKAESCSNVVFLSVSHEPYFYFMERQETGTEAFLETYLTIEELAGYLKLAEQTIRRWVLNREIPFHKIKKVIRFRVSEVEKWIDGGGCKLPEEKSEGIEGDLFSDASTLDELAETEQADGEKADGANNE